MILEKLFLVFAGASAALLTFLLHAKFKQGAVRASAIIGIFISILVLIFPNLFSIYLTKNLPLVCFGTSFIGMVSVKITNNYFLIGLASVIFTIIFINVNDIINGLGGGLGALAFISLQIALSILILTKKLSKVE